MERAALKFSAFALATASLAAAAPAQASIGFGMLPMAIAFSAIAPSTSQCGLALAPGAGTRMMAEPVSSISKATAILGGKVSQLELIARAQAGSGVLQPETTALSPSFPQEAFTASPATFGNSNNCLHFAVPASVTSLARPGLQTPPLGSDDFLASMRVSIKHTSFDAAWNRVRQENLPRGLTSHLAGLGTDRTESALLGTVNAWTNAKVRDVEDAVQYGQSDYWASASTTLTRGAGDCEDIAIAKMQILAAMGVRRSDMYLTIARDLIRNADHAVLIVKAEGKFWLLDNATDQVLDASQSNNYRPIMSFSTSRSWLHGNWHPNAR